MASGWPMKPQGCPGGESVTLYAGSGYETRRIFSKVS